MTVFFKPYTKIKNFIPLPRFILAEDLPCSAKLIYGLLVARTMVSQKEENANKWSDTVGNIYIMYTIRHLAKDTGLSASTVKTALAQLKAAGLIQTIKNGNNKPNTIYVKFPENAFKETLEEKQDGYVITFTHPDGAPITEQDFEEAERFLDDLWITDG